MTTISKEQATAILERFRAGTTTLKEERERLGIKYNTTIRKAVVALLDGDRDAFHALVRAAKKPRGVSHAA